MIYSDVCQSDDNGCLPRIMDMEELPEEIIHGTPYYQSLYKRLSRVNSETTEGKKEISFYYI